LPFALKNYANKGVDTAMTLSDHENLYFGIKNGEFLHFFWFKGKK